MGILPSFDHFVTHEASRRVTLFNVTVIWYHLLFTLESQLAVIVGHDWVLESAMRVATTQYVSVVIISAILFWYMFYHKMLPTITTQTTRCTIWVPISINQSWRDLSLTYIFIAGDKGWVKHWDNTRLTKNVELLKPYSLKTNTNLK